MSVHELEITRKVLRERLRMGPMWKPYREVTDDEWAGVSELIPELRPRKETRGRRSVDARAVLNGALWVLANNRPWAELPPHFPSYQTCHRRWKAWLDGGAFERMVRLLFGKAANDVMDSVRMRTARSNVEPIVWRRCVVDWQPQGPVIDARWNER
jgi:transposase